MKIIYWKASENWLKIDEKIYSINAWKFIAKKYIVKFKYNWKIDCACDKQKWSKIYCKIHVWLVNCKNGYYCNIFYMLQRHKFWFIFNIN